jgi:hypothetical protein
MRYHGRYRMAVQRDAFGTHLQVGYARFLLSWSAAFSIVARAEPYNKHTAPSLSALEYGIFRRHFSVGMTPV